MSNTDKKSEVQFISTGEAMRLSGASRPTVIQWCKVFGAGVLVAGRWKVDVETLKSIMRGERHYDHWKNKESK